LYFDGPPPSLGWANVPWQWQSTFDEMTIYLNPLAGKTRRFIWRSNPKFRHV